MTITVPSILVFLPIVAAAGAAGYWVTAALAKLVVDWLLRRMGIDREALDAEREAILQQSADLLAAHPRSGTWVPAPLIRVRAWFESRDRDS